MKKAKLFIVNGILMTAVSLIIRTVGVAFNAYVSNKVGASAMGLYSLIMSIYFFAVTFATSGVNLAATRMVAEALGRSDCREARRAMNRCIVYSLCFGLCGGAVLFIFADFIGVTLLGDARTVNGIHLLSLSLAPLALSSAMTGYFTAVRRVVKNAADALFEQFVKIAVCTFLLLLLMPKGMEYACLALVGGGTVAEICSFLLMLTLFLTDRHRHLRCGKAESGAAGRALTKKLLGISLPVALSAYARAGLVTVEHALIPRSLMKSGATRDSALASYGLVYGMVLPVVLYPSAVTGAFASLLVPEFAEFAVKKDAALIRSTARRVISAVLIFSVGTAGIMSCFSHELGILIYGSAEAGRYIRMLAPLIPVMYLDTAVDAMLKGLGQQVYSMGVNIADAAVSVLLVWLVVPGYGIDGYVAAIYFCELLNGILSLYRLVYLTDVRINYLRTLVLPLLAAASSALLCRTLLPYVSVYLALSGGAETVSGIVLSVLLYAGAAYLFGKPALGRENGMKRQAPTRRKINISYKT